MIKYAALKIERHLIKKTTSGKNLLHNLHRKMSGFHSFIFNLIQFNLKFHFRCTPL